MRLIKVISAFTLIALVSVVVAQNEKVVSCTQTLTREEECIVITSCPQAIDDLKNRKAFPQTCGFQGVVPLVCCFKNSTISSTTSSPVVTTTETKNNISNFINVTDDSATTESKESRIPGLISKQKCRQYSKSLSAKYTPPVLIVDVNQYVRNVCDFRKRLVVGGNHARKNEFPHMALVGHGNSSTGIIKWDCGGSVISEQYVMTAAHCVSGSFSERLNVKVGMTNRMKDTRNVQQFKVIEVLSHPEFNRSTIRYGKIYNDIALLKLEKPIEINAYAAPACLFTEYTIPTDKAIATGWGVLVHSNREDDELHKVTVKFVSTEECNKVYSKLSEKLESTIRNDSQLCAGAGPNDTLSIDLCTGDSGGPLQIYHTSDDVQCMYDIVGVVSFGSKICGHKNVPGGYTRVSHYIKWIEDIVWPQTI